MDEAVRNLPYLSFKQNDSINWMESMEGEKWNNLIAKENEHFEKVLKNVSTPEKILEMKEIFSKQKPCITFQYKFLKLNYLSSEHYEYIYLNKKYTVKDLEIRFNRIFQILDIGNGAEKYRLECLEGEKVIWHLDDVGTQFFIKDNSIFTLKAKNKLWYHKVIEVNIDTGAVRRELYKEKDDTYNLSLVKRNNSFFIIRDNYEKQECMILKGKKLQRLGGEVVYPIDNTHYFEYKNEKWNSVGFIFPHKISGSIEYISLEKNIFIERYHGRKTIYLIGTEKLFPIYSYYGNLIINPWHYEEFDDVYLDTPNYGLLRYELNEKPNVKVNGIFTHHFFKSYDSTYVPSISMKPFNDVKGLIVVGYGAYGIETNVSMWRWKPYLDDGWIISFIFVRGSGDNNIEWAKAGKTVNKINSICDFEYGIQYLQKKLNISPDKTCIFGRSAGGYLVGSVLTRNPTGSLFKMLYTEVPYVDILRTTTNPTLPLTTLEYKEFGNPAESIYEFQELLKISPIDSITKSPDSIFVLARTSLNDSQVYTYEALKWITLLRKNSGDNLKLIAISKDEGHFVSNTSLFSNLAEDFFLLKSIRDNGRK